MSAVVIMGKPGTQGRPTRRWWEVPLVCPFCGKATTDWKMAVPDQGECVCPECLPLWIKTLPRVAFPRRRIVFSVLEGEA